MHGPLIFANISRFNIAFIYVLLYISTLFATNRNNGSYKEPIYWLLIKALQQPKYCYSTVLLNLTERVSVPHKQYYPQAGFVEHDPVEIFNNTLSGIKQLISNPE